MTDFGLVAVPDYVPLVLLVGWAAVCLVVAVKSLTGAALLVVVTGVVQWPLIALLGALSLQLLTDVAALILIAATSWRCRRRLLRPLPLAVGLATLAFLTWQVSRATDDQAALQATRQIVYPALLVMTGFLLRHRIHWALFGRCVAYLGGAVAIYVIAEKVIGHPLIDPAPAELALAGGNPNILRDGLPFAYVSDGIGDQPYFRPGGPLFNPPIAGIFIGASVYAALRWLAPLRGSLIAAVGATATILSVTRAGVLLIAAVAITPVLVRLTGRWGATVLAVVAGAWAAVQVSDQGNTAAHGTGLLQGIEAALRDPLGTGLGTQGFFAARSGAGEAIDESLLGVTVAGLGIVALAGVLALLVLVVRPAWSANRRLRPVHVYPLGVLAVAALSESAAALRGTAAMWLLMGEALAIALGHWRMSADPARTTSRATRVLWLVRDPLFHGGAERVGARLSRGVAESVSVPVVLIALETAPQQARRSSSAAGAVLLRSGLPFGGADLAAPAPDRHGARGALASGLRRRFVRGVVSMRLVRLLEASPDSLVVVNHNALLPGAIPNEALDRVVLHVHTSAAEVLAATSSPRPRGLVARLRLRSRRQDAREVLRVAARCASVVCTSYGEATQWQELTGREVVSIPNPLTWPLPVRADARPASQDRGLLFVGRLSPEKRPDLVLEVAAELRRRGESVTPLLVGDGPERGRLLDQAAALGFDTAVLPGSTETGPHTYLSRAVLLLPSDFEALPLVLMEAASQGMPSVATQVSEGITWIAGATGSVRVVARGDVSGMADAVAAWWRESPSEALDRHGTAIRGLRSLDPGSIHESWRHLLALPRQKTDEHLVGPEAPMATSS